MTWGSLIQQLGRKRDVEEALSKENHTQGKRLRKEKIVELKRRVARGEKLTQTERDVLLVWERTYGREK